MPPKSRKPRSKKGTNVASTSNEPGEPHQVEGIDEIQAVDTAIDLEAALTKAAGQTVSIILRII
jgi:hypothetical protein